MSEPTIIAGKDVSDWESFVAGRELPDGRVIVLYRDLFNMRLTISSAEGWGHGYYDDAW